MVTSQVKRETSLRSEVTFFFNLKGEDKEKIIQFGKERIQLETVYMEELNINSKKMVLF